MKGVVCSVVLSLSSPAPNLVPRLLVASFSGLCALVACSTKFAQKAWSILSRDVCHSLHHNHSTGINDVIDELAPCLALKEGPKKDSDGSCANLPTVLSRASAHP